MKIVMDDLPLNPSQCPFHLYYRIRPCWDEKAICKLKNNQFDAIRKQHGYISRI